MNTKLQTIAANPFISDCQKTKADAVNCQGLKKARGFLNTRPSGLKNYTDFSSILVRALLNANILFIGG